MYAPTLSTTLIGNERDRPAGSIFDGGDVVTDRFLRDSVDIVQPLPWKGGQYSAQWIGGRSTSTNVFNQYDPYLQSNLSLNYTQPLVRDFGIDGFRQHIAVTRANRDLSEIDLRHAIVSTERNVRNAYWQLVFARSFLEVQRQSLALAEESLRNNRTRVEVGTMAAIDIVEAENEVARNIEAVIRAEAAVERAEDRLRTLVLDPAETPDYWSISLQPSDSPMLQARDIDVDAAVRNALLNRTDLDTLDNDLEVTDTNIRYHRNQQLPDVSLQVNYGLEGAGGDQLLRTGGFPGTVVGRQQKSFGGVLGEFFANEFPSWTVGVTSPTPSARARPTPPSSAPGSSGHGTRRGAGASSCRSPQRSGTRPGACAPTSSAWRPRGLRANLRSAASKPSSASSRWAWRRTSWCSRRNAIWRRRATRSKASFSTTSARWWTSMRSRRFLSAG